MPSLDYHTVDAFTSVPFSGNQAAVIVLPRDNPPADSVLQQIAAEFNFAETAFATPLEDHSPENPHFNLRWMTPEAEVPLCGHATQSTAAVLFSESSPSSISATSIRFETLSGTLTVRKVGDQISMDFPAAELDTVATEGAAFDKVSAAVEKAASALKGKVVNIAWYKGFGAIVEIDESVSIEGIPIDTSFFDKEVAPFLLILTQPSSSADYNVYSRVFAPAVGVNEDPVTGAAHTVICPYWKASSLSKLAFSGSAKDAVLRCRQVSKRGGDINVVLDEEKGRVELVGSARLMMKGTLTY